MEKNTSKQNLKVLTPFLHLQIPFYPLYNNDKLLPSISDYDITDIIQFIKMFFPIGSDFNQTIKGLLEDQEIKLNENEYLNVSSLIIDFIYFLNNI